MVFDFPLGDIVEGMGTARRTTSYQVAYDIGQTLAMRAAQRELDDSYAAANAAEAHARYLHGLVLEQRKRKEALEAEHLKLELHWMRIFHSCNVQPLPLSKYLRKA